MGKRAGGIGGGRKGAGAMAGGQPSTTATTATSTGPQPSRRDNRPASGKALKRKAVGNLKGPAAASKILVKREPKAATVRTKQAASKGKGVNEEGDSEDDEDDDDDGEEEERPKVRPGPKRSALATTTTKQLATTKSRSKKSSGYLSSPPPSLYKLILNLEVCV